MAPRPDLDQRFAHFCRSGDPGALGEVFDATARELLHVAVWLMRHRADAEDLLQRTFLAAIETRARFAPGQPVLPWLMGILANEARHLRRERERKLAAAPPPPTRDPEAEVAAGELDAAVRQIGAELGEPYRDVLSLHLQQGMNAKEIAERLQRPGGTVRTQLVRALELLRKKLPSGFVAGFAPLLLPEPAVLATVRTAVMQAAQLAVQVAASVVGAATTWTLTGSLTMSKKFAALVAVAVLLIGGAVAWALQGDAEKPSWPGPVAAQGAVDAKAGDVVATPAAVQRTEVAEPKATPSPTTGSLLVHVFWQEDESPAVAVGVAVWPARGYATQQERLSVSDAAGQCRFDALPPGDYSVESASGITRQATITAGATCDLRLPANHGATAHGVVVDEFARPVAGAQIWLSEEVNWFRGYIVAESDAAGRFSIPTGYNEYIGARKAGYVPSYWRSFHAYWGDPPQLRRDFEFTLQLRGTAGSVRGRVVDAEHRPVAGARVFVGSQVVHQAPGIRGLNGEYEPRGVTVVSDADGNFARDDVPPGPTDVRAWAEGHGPVESGVMVQASAVATIELLLPPPATLQGVVRDGDGRAVAGALLQIGATNDFLTAATQSGVDGSYRLGDLAAGKAKVTVTKAGALRAATMVQHHEDGTSTLGAENADLGKARGSADGDLKVEAAVVLAAGTTTTWDPVLAGTRTLRGVVLDPSGQPMREVYVHLEPWLRSGGGGRTAAMVDAEGRFAYTDVAADGMQILTVCRGGTDLRAVAVPPGQDEVTIRLVEDDLPTASLRLRLVDAAGNPFAGTVMCHHLGDPRSSGMPQDKDTGVFRERAVRPGDYELVVATAEMTLPLPPVTLGAHEAKDLGDIVVPAPAKLLLHVQTAAGAPAGSGRIAIVTATGQSCVISPPQLRRGELEVAVAPGTFCLIVNTDDATAATAVTLRSGTTTECRVTLPACRAVPLAIVPDAGLFAFGMTTVLVHTADGRLQYCGHVFTQQDGSITSTFHLSPGNYTFTAIGPGESRGTATAKVPADGTVPPLQISLHAAH